ncbi:hypothetical protein HPB48_000307 [Haemaphysalis longicornis]|uniref:Endonuclease/exonuclease/phosphatase domain-containing protein n=1 Tax=Haemaphysalis longicornis TaxID=44386 RepID=A0A9J6G6B1_HAELO|nr:hypothetical protein HPB48_000307 [Haemaphysalis longicornis]
MPRHTQSSATIAVAVVGASSLLPPQGFLCIAGTILSTGNSRHYSFPVDLSSLVASTAHPSSAIAPMCCLMLPYLSKSFTDIVLFGDFNAHIGWWQHDESLPKDSADDSLLDIVSSANLHQVYQNPSYASQGQSSFLDLVFVRNISWVTSCQVRPGLTGSDHSAI